jgi:hypothetical protein
MPRKDVTHPIIFMQCRPLRKRVDACAEAARRPFDHHGRIRQTAFRLPNSKTKGATVPIQHLYRALLGDEGHNALIVNDLLAAQKVGRSPRVITERTDHLEALPDRLARFANNVIFLRGGQSEWRSSAKRWSVLQRSQIRTSGEPRFMPLVDAGRRLGARRPDRWKVAHARGISISAWTHSCDQLIEISPDLVEPQMVNRLVVRNLLFLTFKMHSHI